MFDTNCLQGGRADLSVTGEAVELQHRQVSDVVRVKLRILLFLLN